MRVIVVGSGLGGLLTALEARDAGAEVLLVTKGALADANTTHAQGGVAVALFPDDSVAAHVADTLLAGAGLCDPEAVEVLCAEGPARVRELIARGVRFDRVEAAGGAGDAGGAGGAGGAGDVSGIGELARGLEAAHSSARIVHAGGDATGAEIERALIRAVREAGVASGRIVVREHSPLAELLVSDGTVVGIELADGTIELADAVVLATGGAGQLFAHTTNPAVATGDGVAAAWRAGAAIADAEFYQFHPTALAAPGSFLISEAIRGEGAVLRNARGERFMRAAPGGDRVGGRAPHAGQAGQLARARTHPDAELAPRDVVARAIADEMAAQNGAPVFLDATGLGASVLARRFPTIDAHVRAAGFDWAREPIPVTPAAHYWMGGIATDAWARTSLPGLWAVGECASTGVHGANRLASNSLLEAAVFAHRAAQDAVALSLVEERAGARVSERMGEAGSGRDRFETRPAAAPQRAGGTTRPAAAPQRAGGTTRPAAAPGRAEETRPGGAPGPAAETRRLGGGPGRFERAALQRLMWEHAGVERSGEGLRHAASVLACWNAEDLEDRNLLDLARIVVDAALAREESRGAHYRTDFPTPDPETPRRHVVVREGASVC